jgi:hypothetical protein
MSVHAMEEMAEDGLDIVDIEHAVLNGRITRTEKGELRGMKYSIEGFATDERISVGVVGRFTTAGRYLIITVYEITDSEG